MEVGLFPEFRWQIWAAGVGLVLSSALLAGSWRRAGAFGRAGYVRASIAALTWLGTAFLSLALCAPGLSPRADSQLDFSAVVLLDVSDSMLRVKDGWTALRPAIVSRLRQAFGNRANGRASAHVVTFRSEASSFGGATPLWLIGDAMARLTPSSFATGDGTNIAAGLVRASDLVDKSGGRGAVVLFSDGNETEGDAVQAAVQLGRKGVPVYVAPMAGGPPELAIVEANLPANVDAGSETYVRGMVLNAGPSPVRAELALDSHALAVDEDSTGAAAPGRRIELTLEPGVWNRYRSEVVFEKPGLQFVDIALKDKMGPPHTQRLFTMVESPLRLLAVGDDLWAGAFPPGSVTITKKLPRAVTAKEVRDNYDGFVIDSVPASDFSPDTLRAIAETVKTGAAGLFLMNGRHLGTPRDATNLMSYNSTPLEDELPLVSRPRPKEAEPPPRNVVILIDVSGSMNGDPIQQEQQIATYVIQKLLRPEDKLDVCAFTTQALEMTPREMLMNDQGKEQASRFIKSLRADGGTDPTPCLRLIADRQLSNCGLIFLSDGYFYTPAVQRPDCRTTAFGIGRTDFGPNDPLRELADPIGVPPGFDPSRIRIPYFEKRPEDQFYEVGKYRPLPMNRFIDRGDTLAVPDIHLDGSATTYAKQETELVAVRPKLTDPILAYKDANAGRVGEFTSNLPQEWLSRKEGRQAIRRWIERVLPISDRRRYQLQVAPRNTDLEIEISLTPRSGHVPDVQRLAVALETGGVTTTTLAVRRDEAIPAVFHVSLPLPQGGKPAPATLVVRESGPGALPRPQRLQALLPPAGQSGAKATREAYTYGLNEDLLRRVAAAGGGAYDALDRVGGFGESAGRSPVKALWPSFAIAGCVCYLLAVFLRRLDI